MKQASDCYCTFFSACLPPYKSVISPPVSLDQFFYVAAYEWEFMIARRVFTAATADAGRSDPESKGRE